MYEWKVSQGNGWDRENGGWYRRRDRGRCREGGNTSGNSYIVSLVTSFKVLVVGNRGKIRNGVRACMSSSRKGVIEIVKDHERGFDRSSLGRNLSC